MDSLGDKTETEMVSSSLKRNERTSCLHSGQDGCVL